MYLPAGCTAIAGARSSRKVDFISAATSRRLRSKCASVAFAYSSTPAPEPEPTRERQRGHGLHQVIERGVPRVQPQLEPARPKVQQGASTHTKPHTNGQVRALLGSGERVSPGAKRRAENTNSPPHAPTTLRTWPRQKYSRNIGRVHARRRARDRHLARLCGRPTEGRRLVTRLPSTLSVRPH